MQLIALFTQAVDKPDHLVRIAHGLGIGHDQLPFLAAQTRGVFLRQLHQGSGPVSRGRLRHERLSIQKAVDPVPCLRLGNGFGLFQRSIPGNGKALCLRRLLGSLRHFAGGFQIRVNEGLQHGFHAVGHFLLLLRGQLGKYAVRVWMFGGPF